MSRSAPVLLLLLLASTACRKDPCAVYAEKLCGDLGAGHEECRNAREAAEDHTDEMRAVCEEALASYDDVLRILRRPPNLPAPTTTPTTGPPPSSAPAPSHR